jgi:hypothetical protein
MIPFNDKAKLTSIISYRNCKQASHQLHLQRPSYNMAADLERHYQLLCDYTKSERRPAEKDHYRDHKL